jgi:hypothetical protein
MIMLEENQAREGHAATQAGRPRTADLPYKRSPQAPIFCRQDPSRSSVRVLKFSCPDSP